MAVISCLLLQSVLVVVILHLKLMETSSVTLVVNSNIVDLPLVLTNRHKQLRVGLLTGQEPMDDFVNIGETSSCSNLLEGILNVVVLVHFLFHLLLQEGREESLYKELLLLLNLFLVLVLVGGHLSNLLLATDSLHSALHSFLLVADGLLKAADPLLAFSLVLLDLHHNLLKLHFGLDPFLLGAPLLLGLLANNVVFRFHRFLKFLGTKLRRNKVSLHPLDHVLILHTGHLLELVLFH
mmetsp:Transcript_31104/g.47507  ORF Transcript_31104/g.47507 Transcript_31104/m.47507 type:complete len:238 (-) Transcript_31104:463-1176(-)